jgi:ABC-2 type transport system ATP-binding protein
VTVHDLLAQFARLYPNPLPVAAALEMVDLLDDVDAKVGVLSGGQRRRTDLAVGIIGRPEVLFLDEPTTALDPEARRRTCCSPTSR